ncbi:MAG: AMP-binding protein [Acidimicrobiia bacterium]|nr:AMP-binding protein [Acidimicrobiia bacterium]
MATFNLADLFFTVAEAVRDRPALVCVPAADAPVIEAAGASEAALGATDDPEQMGVRLDYEALAARVHATAHRLRSLGVAAGDRVGVHLRNRSEHVEALLACFALRAVPCNVNYRYVEAELAELFGLGGFRVVLSEPDLVAGARRAAAAMSEAPAVVAVDSDWHTAVAQALRAGPILVEGRSGDDLHVLFTGGTTGPPKGVVWRHEDLYQAALGGRGVPSRGVPAVDTPDAVADRALGHDPIRRRLPFCPLIHGGASWITLQALLSGGTAVVSTARSFDAGDALDLLAHERIQLAMVIGDAVAKPMAERLAAEPGRWSLLDLAVIASGGAVLSPSVVASLQRSLPGVAVLDTFGASESGGQGRLQRNEDGSVRLLSDDRSEVLDEWGVPTPVGEVGWLARRGHVPVGYLDDPERSARTFPVIDGVRWSIPGDKARRESDGSITVLGRGATSINTGGEKVFPEEVEATVKGDPSVADCLVVGVPDDRFGERVVAVVALHDGPSAGALPTELAARLEERCREQLAGYKVPRSWVVVPRCQRLATGKPDYLWARGVATAG